MGDQPPPLPPKLKVRYTEEDCIHALEEEKRAFEKIQQERLGRYQPQRSQKNSAPEFSGRARSVTPTLSSSSQNSPIGSQFVGRPIPKPRSISLRKDDVLPKSNTNRTDSNQNIHDNTDSEANKDLMSFASPERSKSGVNNSILKKIQDLNKNQNNLALCRTDDSLSKNLFTTSSSVPLGMNFMNINFTPGNSGQQWNSGNPSSNALSTLNFNSLSNFSSSISPAGFNLPSSIPLAQPNIPAVPPPLPGRSPVLNMSSFNQPVNVAGPIDLPTTTGMPFSKIYPLTSNVNQLNSSSAINSGNLSNSVKQNVIVPFLKNNISPSVPSFDSIKSLSSKLAACPKSSNSGTSDLIDLHKDDSKHSNRNSMFSSLLDDFDPLKVKPPIAIPEQVSDEVGISSEAQELFRYKTPRKNFEDEQSYYEQDDPFQYMHPSGASTRSDPIIDIYDGLRSPSICGSLTFDVPPPLPPKCGPIKEEAVLRRKSKKDQSKKLQKREVSVHEGKISDSLIQLRKMDNLCADKEAEAFWNRISKLRSEYISSDYIGNPGLLHSPCLEMSYNSTLSVKLAVYFNETSPVMFTCNLNTSIEHVVMQALVALDLNEDGSNFLLKVRGIDEYMCSGTQLGEYEYVHLCIKYDDDILLTLVAIDQAKKSYLRTEEDDRVVQNTDAHTLLRVGSKDAVYYDSLVIAVEAFEVEVGKLERSGTELLEGTPNHELSSPMRSRHVRQIVKQICALLGEIETVEVSLAIEKLIETCKVIQKSQGVLDGEDDVPGHAGMMLTGSQEESMTELKQKLQQTLAHVSASVSNFLFMYSTAFRVDFTVDKPNSENSDGPMELCIVRDRIKVNISGLHRLDSDWTFDEFFVEAQIFHGTSCLNSSQYTRLRQADQSPKFYTKVNFSQCLDMEARVNSLTRESRLVFTLYGVRRVIPENKESFLESRFIREEIGWSAIQLFSYDGYLVNGGFMLTLWPMVSDKRLSPAPRSSDHPFAHSCPILCVELTDMPSDVYFPDVEPSPPKKLSFEDLDVNTQQQLRDIIERDIFTFSKSSIEEREILWEKRHYLQEFPEALAHVLLAAHSWDFACLPDLHSIILNWTRIKPPDALHLLLPCFPDTVTRNSAVSWIRDLGSDELITYLPQLVQAVKHEAWDVSNLAELLIERALTSPRLAHHLYWLLNQCLPLQTSMGGEKEVVADARYSRRLNMITRALMRVCGKNMESRLLRQEALLRTLYETALVIKDSKDSQRLFYLHHELKTIHENLKDSPTSLPLSPSFEVSGVDIEACSYYTSFTIPLRLAFMSSEPNTKCIHTIFKVGDDLRQDMLVIQMIRLMDKLWLKEGLDLKIVTFNVVPTGDRIGILEMVRDAETLRKIQIENGLTGSFKERPIAEWLAKHNPSQLEYHRAVANFTESCAGYCVATYILGICDRHNDNIMLKTSGHLFHIDFGKFLGDAQKFGNVKRDRTPFVLTSDMAFVINGGEKPSDKFQAFVDLCCKAFNIIRQNAHLLLYLFALMASSGIPGVTSNAVHYVEKALLQDKTNAEAGAFFARMIQESLKNWFTQVNFFIHNLAQLRFTGDHSESDSLLSFVPHTYTMAVDGRIRLVRLFSFQKRYNPYKYYVYILKVEREGQTEPSFLFRSYKEFSEFHQKLCCIFPLARIHSLPKGVQIGRSEVKAVVEKRKFDIELFLSSLFTLTDEIAHSDLVYTFLHPLLRDQEDTDIHIRKLKIKDNVRPGSSAVPVLSGSLKVQGQVKVSLQYIRGQLQIVVQHARNLTQDIGSPEPSPYVKLYLLPDTQKKTKRKTKVVKKTCHPTFMEMITYRMSLALIQSKVLEVSVWSEDKFSENSYLGSAYLKLGDLDWKEETCEWLSLESNIRTAREHILPVLSS